MDGGSIEQRIWGFGSKKPKGTQQQLTHRMVVEIQFGRSSSMEGTHSTQVWSGRSMVFRGSDRNIWCGSMEDYKKPMPDFPRQCKDKGWSRK